MNIYKKINFAEKFRGWWLIGLLFCLAACSKNEEAASTPQDAPQEAQEAEAPRYALFYYDLGPAAVDVSGYPKQQQENYDLFLSVCGACHTTARPLNSPYTDSGVWRRFVQRMHTKMEGRGIQLSEADQKRVIDFLVYDSKVRKIDRKPEFEALQEDLKKQFEDLPQNQ